MAARCLSANRSISKGVELMTLSLIRDTGVSLAIIEAELLQVVFDLHPDFTHDGKVRLEADWRLLSQRGPELFMTAAIDPKTGESRSQLGGMNVPLASKDAVFKRLRDLGYEVRE